MLHLASNNNISVQGVQYLANALETNTVRESLFLSITYLSLSIETDTYHAKSRIESI
jgi:hypothetical protein